MKVTIAYKPEITLLTLNGTFNIRSAPKLEQKLQEALRKNPALVGLNLADVYHMDSSAIGALIRLRNEMMNRDSKLVLIDLSKEVMSTFRLARLDSYFQIISQEEFEQKYGDG